MLELRDLFSAGKRRFIVALLLAVSAGVLMLGITGSSSRADTSCPSGSFCAWRFQNYGGIRTSPPYCSGGGGIGENFSAKNRCGKAVRLGWSESGFINWKFCMNPGGDRPDPGRFNFYSFQAGC